MVPLIGRKVAVAYHLMNDGGLLTSGLALPEGSPARDMGDAVNAGAVADKLLADASDFLQPIAR